MSKRMFIAVGTTAMNAVTKLIYSLKECGIYNENKPDEFQDRFVAIDTDDLAVGIFSACGSSTYVHGISILPSEAQHKICPARDNIGGGSVKGKNLLKEISPDFYKCPGGVTVPAGGVYGKRQRSYADLSWREELSNLVDEFTRGRTRDDKDEIIVVATSFGGSSSGFFFNVGEVARNHMPKYMPLYAMVIMPGFEFAQEGFKEYEDGWNNFCNFWQQWKQMIWEHRLAADENAPCVFPFYGGMTEKDFEKQHFPLKSDIEKFKSEEEGVKATFNRVFPVIPRDPKTRDKMFPPNAAAELAIFLFYQNVVKQLQGSDNPYTATTPADNEGEVPIFVGLNLVSARVSPNSLFYQEAIKIFNRLGEEFFCNDDDGLISAIPLESVKGGEWALPENVKEKIDACGKAETAEQLTALKNAAKTLIEKMAPPMPAFGEFVSANDTRLFSFPQALKTYQDVIRATREQADRAEDLEKEVDAILVNKDGVAEDWQKRFLASLLDSKKNIETSIQNQAAELLKRKSAEFFDAYILRQRLAHLIPQANVFADTVTDKVLSETDVKTRDIKFVPVSDETQGVGKDPAFFGSIAPSQLDLAGKIDQDEAFKADLKGIFTPFFCDMLASAEFDANTGMASAGVNPNSLAFNNVISAAAERVKNECKAKNQANKATVNVGIRKEQTPYLSTDNGRRGRRALQGKSPWLFYIENDGGLNNSDASPVNFKMTHVDLGQDMICNWGFEGFKETEPAPPAIFSRLELGVQPPKERLNELKANEFILAGGARMKDPVTAVPADPNRTDASLAFKTDSIGKVEENPNLLGLWAGQIMWCMEARQVVFSDFYWKQFDRRDDDDSDTVRDLMQSEEYMTPESLRKRLLFPLREDVLYGTVFGVIDQKAKEAVAAYQRERDDMDRPKVVNAQTKIEVKFDFPDCSIPPIQGEIERAGFAKTGAFQSAPFDFMIALSRLLRREGNQPSKLAASFDAVGLEQMIDSEEWTGVLTHMAMKIPEKIRQDLRQLRAKIEERITVTLS